MTCLDAQRRYEAITRQPLGLPALHAVAATGAMGATAATTRIRTRPRLSPYQRAAGAAEAVVAQGAALDRGGRDPVRLWHIRQLRCGHLRRSARPLKSERAYLIFETYSYAMRGTTGARPPRNYTINLSRAASKSGSARRTSSLVHRCSEKSIRA